MAGEVLRARQTEQVPALRENRPEQGLQADGAFQGLALQQCLHFLRVGVAVAGSLAAVCEPVSDECPALLVGDAGVELFAGRCGGVPLRSFSHAIIINAYKAKN